MARQREAARAAWKGSGDAAVEPIWFDLREALGATEFLGYATTHAEGVVTALVVDGRPVERAEPGPVMVVTNQTPFYGESGGQIGDTGTIRAGDAVVRVTDTQKRLGDLFVHVGTLEGGPLAVGDAVELEVDAARRDRIRRAHSATHLLHAALRRHLGQHVAQKGSLVAPDRLRFDFSQPRPMTPDEIRAVEAEVNHFLRQNDEAAVRIMARDDAIGAGAMALFGEKYGDEVRVVSMGQGEDGRTYSVELCGGTHVRRTGDIALFRIVGESAVAAGIRRVEAVTGELAFDEARREHELLRGPGPEPQGGARRPARPARGAGRGAPPARARGRRAAPQARRRRQRRSATASSRWARSASPPARWRACRPRSCAAPPTRSRRSWAPASWRWSASTTARPRWWSASPRIWPASSTRSTLVRARRRRGRRRRRRRPGRLRPGRRPRRRPGRGGAGGDRGGARRLAACCTPGSNGSARR